MPFRAVESRQTGLHDALCCIGWPLSLQAGVRESAEKWWRKCRQAPVDRFQLGNSWILNFYIGIIDGVAGSRSLRNEPKRKRGTRR